MYSRKCLLLFLVIICLFHVTFIACKKQSAITGNESGGPTDEPVRVVADYDKSSDYYNADSAGGLAELENMDYSRQFTVPAAKEAAVKYNISSSVSDYGFNVPADVKNEKVEFKPLMDPPDVAIDKSAGYIVIGHDQTVIYREPDINSGEAGRTKAGDMFIYEKIKEYPDSFDKLSEKQKNELIEKFGDESELSYYYRDMPGEMAGDLFNKWFKVRNNSVSGWVFGSYIYGGFVPGLPYDQAYLVSLLYKRGSVFPSYQDSFFDYSVQATSTTVDGHTKLNKYMVDALESGYLVLEKVQHDEYRLDYDVPDDMVALYLKSGHSRLNPLLITTDFVMHSFHLVFDRALQNIEARFFLPFVYHLNKSMYGHILETIQNTTDIKLRKSLYKLAGYFAVALVLLETPDFSLADIPDEETRVKAGKEIALIEDAAGYNDSPLMGTTDEDYSLFKVRGHYTQTKALGLYFKAMMWLGLAKFPIDRLYADLPEEFFTESMRGAVILTKILTGDDELYSQYQWFMENIFYLIGRSNDVTPIDLAALYRKFPKLNDWKNIADDAEIKKFIAKAKEELPLPQARGTAPGRVFQFIGQRFTIDAYILSRLSHSDVYNRFKISTSDILAALGSKWAEKMVSGEKETYPGYEAKLNEASNYIKKINEKDWFSSFYQSYIAVIRPLVTFPDNTGIPWFDSPNYISKNHLAFLGSYTELKHDTILYSIQASAAEMGGMGYGYSFIIDEIPQARGYIEPNLPFFRNILALHNRLMESKAGSTIMLSNMGENWQSFMNIIERMYDIVKKEVEFRTISQEDYDEIFMFPERLKSVILPSAVESEQGYGSESNDYRMALVTDIYTDSDTGEAYILGTGIPQRIYMTIYDPSGGRRICIGYTYSYYEFYNPIDQRLNDDEWKKKVYDEYGTGIEDKEPGWIKNMRL